MSVVLVSEQKQIVYVTLNRPDVRNAFNPQMIQILTQTFTDLSQRKDIRAIVFQGAGKAFCAGGDLAWMKDMVNFTAEQNKADALQLFEMFEAIFNCHIPIIGLVHGAAFGGALGLMACCDYVICEEKTQMCFSEVKLGIAPAVISAFVLRKCSLGMVTPLMMMGQVFNANTAKSVGLVHEIADEESFSDRLEVALSWLREVGPEAVRATKRLLYRSASLDWNEIKDETAEVITERRISAEGQEGLRSFLEKRTASWKAKA